MTTDPISKRETDHDMLITLLANVGILQLSVIEVKNNVSEVKTMCASRLPHCLGVFATDKRMDSFREEVDKKLDARDQWAKWSLGLSVTSFLGIVGMLITLITK